MRNCIAIIPARSGSKRIKNKNIKDFYGKPLIAWTIEAAKRSELFCKVVVSTDSDEIAEISLENGADQIFERTEYADDYSPVSLATLFTLENIDIEGSEIVFQLMPNCPLRNSDDIKYSFKQFMQGGYKAQISCFKFGWMNPWWALKKEKGAFKKLFDVGETRTQDLPPLFCPTGAIWISEIEELRKFKSFYTGSENYCLLSIKSSVDIDDEEDLNMAKALYHFDGFK